VSVPNRFYGIQDFSYYPSGSGILNYSGVRFGIESVHARWDSKITTGITGLRDYGIAGLRENLGRNDRIKELHRGPSIVTSILRSDGSFFNSTKLEDLQILCTVFIFSKGTISLRAPCALYLVVVVVPRETVRFED